MDKQEANSFSFQVYNLPALNAITASEDLSIEEKETLENQIVMRYASAIEQIPEACKLIRQLELYQKMYKEEEERLYEKRKKTERFQDKIESALIDLIEKSSCDSINSGTFDISIKTTQSVSDDSNIDEVPNDYKYTKFETKLDKMKIKSDIKKGIDIKGIVLQTNKHITIK